MEETVWLLDKEQCARERLGPSFSAISIVNHLPSPSLLIGRTTSTCCAHFFVLIQQGLMGVTSPHVGDRQPYSDLHTRGPPRNTTFDPPPLPSTLADVPLVCTLVVLFRGAVLRATRHRWQQGTVGSRAPRPRQYVPQRRDQSRAISMELGEGRKR